MVNQKELEKVEQKMIDAQMDTDKFVNASTSWIHGFVYGLDIARKIIKEE